MLAAISLAVFVLLPRVSGHSAFFHPSMFGFNVTEQTFPYDNRPVAPIKNMNFQEWWFHNHLDHPPNEGDFFELPAGQPATAEIACNKGATSFFASSEGGDIRDGDNVCPNSSTEAYHTKGIDDLEGCALAIAYKNDAKAVQPEDFTVFSVNQTCVWTRFTDFQVPERMPPCPDGGCICAFFWIHSPKSGGEENYMNGFKCNVTGATSNVPVAPSKLARRCGTDPDNQKLQSAPGNCTYGAKQPYYWFNNERNNMFEGTFSPPVYNDRYNFLDGAQDDIFIDSYLTMPDPAPNAPMPLLADVSAKSSNTNTTFSSSSSSSTSGSTSGTAKTCKSKSSASSSSTLSTREMYEGHSTKNLGILAMSRRSRRLNFHKRERLWHMW
ncbi:hypothetical protein B0H34DRAFT_801848 [Crassisporium funariophilum]|nr:hypothetical protein B0H34DRAFT_801848 [Crassisporium funariophilum]